MWHMQDCIRQECSQAVYINPLTTNDDYSRHQNLAACYQLAQSVLKIGSVIAEWGDGWVHYFGWQCMAAIAAGYRMGLVSAGWPVLLLSCTNKCRKRSFHLVGTPFQTAFSLEERSLEEGPDYWMSNEWVMNLQKTSKEAVDQVYWANCQQKWKYKWDKSTQDR